MLSAVLEIIASTGVCRERRLPPVFALAYSSAALAAAN